MHRLSHGSPLYLTAEVRRIEALAAAAPERPQLMERAGLAAATRARELAGDSGRPAYIFAGPGNNGGDAFVVARHLKSWWFNTRVVFTGDATKLSEDAGAALEAWRAAGGSFTREPEHLQPCSLIVDGLFGIGLQRELSGRYATLVEAINSTHAPVLALDVPSGLESDTGRVLGTAVRATHTITFIAAKPGLFTLDGPDHCGDVQVAPLGLHAAQLVSPRGHLIGADVLRTVLPHRRINSHKGDYGSVGVIGGAHGMVGAALLAGRAALKLGAGRVYVGLLAGEAPVVDASQTELMLRRARETIDLDHLSCLAIGPGLGQSEEACELVVRALDSSLPLVIDADGLNLVAAHRDLRESLIARVAPTLLTPHPAEAARLIGGSTREVQRDRLAAALEIARSTRASVVLKGAGSLCAFADGRWAINTSGNPGMATAGMGDVLTGLLAALLAQGADAEAALEAGVYLHGAAADAAVAAGQGPVGLTAGEVIDAARSVINLREAGGGRREAHRAPRQ
jgi:ADP-dependent NAD(P)H-hydrate dehydratase / NAD(P)H-hydrate epimerase